MKSFALAAIVAAFVSAPAFAQSAHAPHSGPAHAHAARSLDHAYPADAYGAVAPYGFRSSATGTDRDQALRDCTAIERKTSPTIRDSNLSMFEYRACMNEHGQPE